MQPIQRLINQLIPFFLAGIAIVAFAFGIFLLAYLFLFGALIGLVLFCLSWIRKQFVKSKPPMPIKRPKKGRIIDSDDWKQL